MSQPMPHDNPPHRRFDPERRASNISTALRAIPPEAAAETPGEFIPETVVRPIRGDDELDSVYRITHDAYVERGYCQAQPDGRLIHYPHLDRLPETTIFIALQNDEIVGTTSMTIDSPAGLHIDSDFKTECDAVRREGKKLAAGWRIATRSSCRSERAVVMALIQETVTKLVEMNVQTSLYTFNPRHERIYQRLLNMRTIARNDGTHGLNNAPAVLMRVDTCDFPERWLLAAAAALRG